MKKSPQTTAAAAALAHRQSEERWWRATVGVLMLGGLYLTVRLWDDSGSSIAFFLITLAPIGWRLLADLQVDIMKVDWEIGGRTWSKHDEDE